MSAFCSTMPSIVGLKMRRTLTATASARASAEPGPVMREVRPAISSRMYFCRRWIVAGSFASPLFTTGGVLHRRAQLVDRLVLRGRRHARLAERVDDLLELGVEDAVGVDQVGAVLLAVVLMARVHEVALLRAPRGRKPHGVGRDPEPLRAYSNTVGLSPRSFSRMPRYSVRPVKIDIVAPKWPLFMTLMFGQMTPCSAMRIRFGTLAGVPAVSRLRTPPAKATRMTCLVLRFFLASAVPPNMGMLIIARPLPLQESAAGSDLHTCLYLNSSGTQDSKSTSTVRRPG